MTMPLPNAPCTIDDAGSTPKRILVIGNGMVSQRFCDEIARRDKSGRYSLLVVGEEPVVAYDRVHLTQYMIDRDAAALVLATEDWYAERGIELRLGERVESVDLKQRIATTSTGAKLPFDYAVFCTGSKPFVPPIPGIDKSGIFVYRTLDDLDRIIQGSASAKKAVVLGGGLLGLEAAKAVYDLGLETHVLEFASRLMPRQLDRSGASILCRCIEELGIHVHLEAQTAAIEGDTRVERLKLADGTVIETDIVVISAGIRPRDELAKQAGIQVHPRGGIVVNDSLLTSAPGVFAIGECAIHEGTVYGLVAPGYAMAETLAQHLMGADNAFHGADMSTKLKLLGVDVASFGDPFAEAMGAKTVIFEDLVKGTYKKLLVSEDCTKLLGGILVGDAADYMTLLAISKSGKPLERSPEQLVMGIRQSPNSELGAETVLCSCNNISVGSIRTAVAEGCATLKQLKGETRAGTGCGGCLGSLKEVLESELTKAGHEVRQELCEHFKYSRQQLFEIIMATRLRSFDELLHSHGKGDGCEVCKPTVASILSSVHNELVVQHDTIQDTNDRFLANIQRGGLYSVVPRIPGGEITPEKLIVLGQVAQKYGLYTKLTGGQRIDLLGAKLDQLPSIWEELMNAGFESGHAYGKSVRTVKSCVGSSWCRFGVQDAVGFAIRVEERYKGIRAPHKLKSAVSGCTRECAEARSKDFGLIATEKGYNLWVCGNGGMTPRHADLLASDLDEQTALQYIDRFLMFYIRTADRLTRTSKWLESMPGGIEHLRSVIVADSLGIAKTLEAEMNTLVAGYECEWAAVVKSDSLRAKFRHFANDGEDDSVELVTERGQRRPVDWPRDSLSTETPHRLPVVDLRWVPMAQAKDFPKDGGLTFRYGTAQIAVFNYSTRGQWYATQAQCPHKGDMILGRGLLGDTEGQPKVACPHHKKCFSLETGASLTGDSAPIRTFPVKLENGRVLVELPPIERSADLIASNTACSQRVSESNATMNRRKCGEPAALTRPRVEPALAPAEPAE